MKNHLSSKLGLITLLDDIIQRNIITCISEDFTEISIKPKGKYLDFEIHLVGGQVDLFKAILSDICREIGEEIALDIAKEEASNREEESHYSVIHLFIEPIKDIEFNCAFEIDAVLVSHSSGGGYDSEPISAEYKFSINHFEFNCN